MEGIRIREEINGSLWSIGEGGGWLVLSGGTAGLVLGDRMDEALEEAEIRIGFWREFEGSEG